MKPRRITDSKSVGLQWIAVEYPTACPWNSDGTLLLLQHAGGQFGLYDGDGAFLKVLPAPIVHSSEPRWSRTNQSQFYFINGNDICQHSTSGTWSMISEFPEYTSISGRGESDLSADGNHLVLAGIRHDGAVDVLVADIKSGIKGQVFTQTEPFDGLKIDSQNRPIISRSNGIYCGERKLTTVNGHSAVCTYQGRPKLLWCSNADAFEWKNAVVMIDIEFPPDRKVLHDFGKQPVAFHISTATGLDWCAVSTYGRDEPSGKLYRVPFDGSGAEVLADEINSNVTDYTGQPKGSVSRDGSKVVYNNNGDVWMVELNAQPSVTMVRVDSRNMANKQFVFEPNGSGDWKLTEITK